MNKTGILWSVPVAVEYIPDTGLHLEIEAPAEARAELAELVELCELPQLSAVFDLIRQGAEVRVVGRVNARVGQTCVVSLEPVENAVDEAVDVRFAPAPGGGQSVPKSARKRSTGGEEPPEPLVDAALDLGALAIEFLILGIDPYPRKTGVQFAPPKVADEGEHPFAALKALNKGPGGGRS